MISNYNSSPLKPSILKNRKQSEQVLTPNLRERKKYIFSTPTTDRLNIKDKNDTTPKNVRFNNQIKIKKIESTPDERFHELLINPGECEITEIELKIQIDKIYRENMELAHKIKENYSKNNNNQVSNEKEINELIDQNFNLQNLFYQKSSENEDLKLKIFNHEKNDKHINLIEKIKSLEEKNSFLEFEINKLKNKNNLILNENDLLLANELKQELVSLKNSIDQKEKEISEKNEKLENYDQLIFFEKNNQNFDLKDYLLICFELERLNFILAEKKKENNKLEFKMTSSAS